MRKRGGRKRALGHQSAYGHPARHQSKMEPGLCLKIVLLMVAGSVSSVSLMTSAGNAWQPWLIHPFRVSEWPENWTIIAERRGSPCMIVSDNGTELTSNAILKWQEDRKVEWQLHRTR